MLKKFSNFQKNKARSASLSIGLLCLALLAVLAAACSTGTQPAAAVTQGAEQAADTSTPAPVATTAVPTPTQTPEPLAVRVNGQGVLLVEFEVELRQLQEAQQVLGKSQTAEEQRQKVLDNLVDTLLLAQGAEEAGFQLDDAALQAEIERMAGEMGGAQALSDWIAQQGYSEPAFRQALRRQMAAAWQRDQIAAQVPAGAEQVHARQILTTDEEIANRALEQVKVPGVNFAAQAQRYDLVTGGDLGWFPRGYLLQPEVEEAAFQLQPGEISPIVKSSIGYHIIQVIAREPNRVLSPDAARILQHMALRQWIEQRRGASQIEILAP